MRLPNIAGPKTYLENTDVICGLKNSLDNSFADPSCLSHHFDSKSCSESKTPSLTLPKEVRIGMYHLEEICTKMPTYKTSLQREKSAKESLTLSGNRSLYGSSPFGKGFCQGKSNELKKVDSGKKKTFEKNRVNVRNAMNKVKCDVLHVDLDGYLNYEVMSKVSPKVEKKFICSSSLFEKMDIENKNAAKKKLMVQNFEKTDVKRRNTEKKNVENWLERKNLKNEDVEEETSVKHVEAGIGWSENDEKGVLDAMNAEKQFTVEVVKEFLEKDNHNQCFKVDEKVKMQRTENVQEIEKNCSIFEKWESEEEEKEKTSSVVALNNRVEQVKILDSKDAVIIDKFLNVVDKDTAINGHQIQAAVRYLPMQITEEKITVTVSEREKDKGVLCPNTGKNRESLSSFKIHDGNLIATKSCPLDSWIYVSSLPGDPACKKAFISHGDDRTRGGHNSSSSFGNYGCGGYSGGKGQGYSGLGGGGGSGGSGGSGDGRGGDGDGNGRGKKWEFSDGERKGDEEKKLKKKCRLEHGFLTKEQISMIVGWLVRRENQAVPDIVREYLKCFSICFENRANARDDCESCLSLCILLTHSSACTSESCRRCDIVLTLYAISCLASENGRMILHPSSFLSQEARRIGMERLRADLAEWSSSDAASATGSEDDGSLSDLDYTLREETDEIPPVPIVDQESNQPMTIVQGPPAFGNFDDDQCVSEYQPYQNYRSINVAQGQARNYSLPADSRSARAGSVIYGTKDLVRCVAKQLNNVATEQRDNPQNSPLHQLAFRIGVILHFQNVNIRIQNNNYELDEEWTFLTDKALGSGVCGSCFVGTDCQTGFAFCVKRIPIHKFYSDEVFIWLDMEHQDIVEFYGIIAYDNYVYILQELIRGPTLKEHITTRRALDAFEALTYLQHLLTLLEYLKRKGVIHNDIKADNLLLREPSTSTRLVLIDFGLANRSSYVNAGVIPVGGPTQWSPEKAASEGYSFPADLWAAVAVFVHMLSGYEPWCVRFRNATLLHYIIKQHSPPMQDVPEHLPPDVYNLIAYGWTVDPDARPTATDLLHHEAFRLLDSCEPSAELFAQHLSIIEYSDSEVVNVEEILDESSTEELISLAQQRFSINQNLSDSQHILVSPGMPFHSTVSRHFSGAGIISGERPSFDEARSGISYPNDRVLSLRSKPLSSFRVMPCLAEETQDWTFKDFDSSVEYIPSSTIQMTQFVPQMVEDDFENLMDKYPDLSIPGFMITNPPELPDISECLSALNLNRSEDVPARQSPSLHRVSLQKVGSIPRRELHSAEKTAPIPTGVEDQTLSSGDENDNESAVLFRSLNDEKDYVDSKTFRKSKSMDESPISMGTTIRMYLGDAQFYCIHLHPGTQSTWSEIFKRASTAIHGRDIVTFTAEICVDDRREAIDVSSVIPSERELRVVIVILSPFQEHGWTWRVEDSRIIYHATYQGHFGPEFD